MTADSFVLAGTREPEPEPTKLVAGALTADLVNGNLRTIRHEGTEVLRAIGYIVRDRDWGTYEPALSNPSVEQSDASSTSRPSSPTTRTTGSCTGRKACG